MEGELVWLSLAGANRKPAVFPDPDRFDVRRVERRLHVDSRRPAVCLGMHLARLEARTAIGRVLERLPGARLDPARPIRPTGLVFRKPADATGPLARARNPAGSVRRHDRRTHRRAERSPIGRRNGTLASVRADDLAADVLNGLVAAHRPRSGRGRGRPDGLRHQIGEQALNVGRVAALVAGWPETVAATTVDRQCGSSMQAAFNASAAIQAGHLDVVVAAGVESMSRVPMGSNLGVEGFAG